MVDKVKKCIRKRARNGVSPYVDQLLSELAEGVIPSPVVTKRLLSLCSSGYVNPSTSFFSEVAYKMSKTQLDRLPLETA